MRFSYVAASVVVIALCLWMASGLIGSQEDGDAVAAESDSASGRETPLMKVAYITGKLTPKTRDVVIQGQLEPKRHILMRAETSSTVGSVEVSKGQRVNAGDIIINLSLSGRETDLREARARVRTASSEQKAAQSLRKQGLQSQVQLEQIQSQLESARAQLDRVQRDITYTRIAAPFAGVINKLPLEVGELVDRGATVAELVDDSTFRVTGNATQQTVSKLTVGKPVKVTLITGETLDGILTFVSSMADNATRSFEIEAEVANPGGVFAAGVSASLAVPIDQISAMFISPSTIALGEQGELGVKIANEQSIVEFMPIDMVSTSLDGAWVTGIPDNSRIITLGQGFVKEGQEVELIEEQAAQQSEQTGQKTDQGNDNNNGAG